MLITEKEFRMLQVQVAATLLAGRYQTIKSDALIAARDLMAQGELQIAPSDYQPSNGVELPRCGKCREYMWPSDPTARIDGVVCHQRCLP